MINIKLMDMPTSVKGFSVRDIDDYTIFINSKYDKNQQEKIYRHELRHIEKEDFRSNLTVDEIECEAHHEVK